MLDYYYLILVVPALLLTMWAQANVNSTFKRYSSVLCRNGLTGASAARAILDRNGLYDVRIERVSGHLSDHFDPRSNVVRLSDSVYDSTSIASIGVAAHECGHAVQYAREYFPIKLRSAIIPVTNFCSKLSMPVFLLGVVLSFQIFINLSIFLFSFSTLFQLITLPVEFDASSRAMKVMREYGLLSGEELSGAGRVLRAAALTYVAALFLSLMQLFRLILLFGRRRDD